MFFVKKDIFQSIKPNVFSRQARNYGLIPKIHVNQFYSIGGVGIGVKHKALSVDHLEELTDEDVQALENSKTMPVCTSLLLFLLGNSLYTCS
jgi:imidazolonepropionase